ncbi:MAG: ABC transporter ATP-binding protein [Lachnospira sp.]|nr:ABC transporter ATP-binding protein [Lachnospira sp.]
MKKRSNIAVMARLIGLVKPLTGYMILAIIMGLIGHLCAAFITIFGGFAILQIIGIPVEWKLWTIFLSMGIFAILRGILRYAEQFCNHFIAFKLLALIRDQVFQALRKLCPAKLESKDKGNLISVITSDIELLEVFYAHTISPIVIAVLFTIAMCVFIGQYHVILACVALAAYITVGLIVPVIVSKCSGNSGIKLRTQSGELSTYVLESLRGLSEIMQYNQGNNRIAHLNQMTDELSTEEEQMKRITGRNMAVTNLLILLFDIAMLFTSAYLFHTGEIEFEGIIISVLGLMSSFGPVVALANLGSTLQNTFAAGNRVLDILEESPVTEEITGKPEITFTGAKAENVSFSYEDELILDQVSLEIPRNKIVGIVGKSGSGKSTFLKLLMRFWNIDSGILNISDISVNQINTTNLRDLEGYMTQETHLFHDSIRNNLRIAKLDATEEEIVAACKKASVHDFIMSLPEGYDSQIGELGSTVSGGEKQRLGLARMFLHNAPLVLLDEPTSNLDSLNEAVILKSLKEDTQGRTVVMVSHRESTMRIADQVYSMNELSKSGRVS